MKKLNLVVFLLMIVLTGVRAQSEALRQKNYNIENGIAISSYDPVSYFKGKPHKGKSSISYSHKGITYSFVNAEDLNEFKQNPEKYEPQYGGWCAYAMGNSGEKVDVDPETYKIIDGKLFLFYNKFFNNTLKTWNKNETVLHKKADDNWMKAYR